MKKIFVLLLVLTFVFSLCSCKAKTEDEASSSTETTTMNTVPNEPTGETETVSQTETTSAVSTTVAPTNPTQTETETAVVTQTQTETQAVVLTGVETITDGNKTIVYPAALRSNQYRYPVIAWANGTGCPTQLYMKLIEAIANAGYIVVADSSVMSGDGTAQIDSINYILNKNNDSSSVFYNNVDTVNIGVCGQSQGGRSCINAAKKDSRIRAVVSLAGASSADEAKGINVPCLFLTATNDNIVKSETWVIPSYNAVTGRAAYASLKGGNHLSYNSMAGYAIDWFNAYLKNDATSLAVFTDGGKLSTDSAWQDFMNKN